MLRVDRSSERYFRYKGPFNMHLPKWVQRVTIAIPALIWISVWIYAVESDSNLGFVDSIILFGLGLVVSIYYLTTLKRWASQRPPKAQPPDPPPLPPLLGKVGNLYPSVAYPVASGGLLLLVFGGALFDALGTYGSPTGGHSGTHWSMLGFPPVEAMIAITILLLVLSTILYGASFVVSEVMGIKLRAINFAAFVLSALFLVYLLAILRTGS